MTSSDGPPTTPLPSSSPNNGTYVADRKESSLSLSDAMKAADCIRKVYSEDDPTESKSMPPGTFEGLGAFVVTGMLLSPLRGVILNAAGGKVAGHSFRNFCDLVITPFMAVVAAQAGLVAGSVFGSRVYLEQVAYVPPSKVSTVTDRACQQLLLYSLDQGDDPTERWTSSSLSSSSALDASDEVNQKWMAGPRMDQSTSFWDPRVETMRSFRLALENCRKRHTLNQSTG
jgi:hypothetical protein